MLSVEKSQILNLGRCEPDRSKLLIDGKQVEFSKSIKYLGIMLDPKLDWNEHIRYIEQKATKVIEVLHKVNWMCKRMRLKDKRTIYMQVAVPAIGYAHRNWFPELKYEYQRKKITRIQRRIILALTRCYRTTSNVKLQRLLGVLDLNKELQFAIDHNGADRETKRKAYDSLMEEQNQLYYEIQETRSKELLWFLSNHGPHRAYLRRFNLTDAESCRLCKSHSTETIEHLMRECEATASWLPEDKDDMEAWTEAIERIVGELRRNDRVELE